MSAVPPPLEIILEFISSDDSSFSWQEREYLVKHIMDGQTAHVRFGWDEPWLRPALEDWGELDPESDVAERLNQCLQKLLGQAHWSLEQDRIERALTEQPPRPVHLIIRSYHADEVYYLPWELLRLKSRKRFVGLEGSLIQYECPLPPRPAARLPPRGRILFAYSNAGGEEVPAAAHLAAIRSACKKAELDFDERQDVLHEVTQRTLAEKLSETERPVTALHLLCHGTQLGDAYGLCLSSTESQTERAPISAAELQDVLFPSVRPPSLRLATLCVCYGGDAGTPAHLLGSVARMFHQQGVPAVIASRLPLSFEGSVQLAEKLYEGLLAQRNLRGVLHEIRRGLQLNVQSRDWLSLQFYARAGDETALTPFSEPPPPAPTPSTRKLILICHEAYKMATESLEASDAPGLFAGRKPTIVPIDQTPELAQRDWKHLEAQVKRLADPAGALRRAFSEREADVVYYGFPYVALAALAGYLAKKRKVHVFECVGERFQWEAGTEASPPPLGIDVQPRDSGDAARLRFSFSAPVRLDDCRQVLPDSEVALDLHFTLPSPKQGSVRREDQLKDYVRQIQDAINQYILGNPPRPLRSVHVFAAVPVSVAFHLGSALAATWMPECFIYNYGKQEQPAYKWRLSLQDAEKGRRSVKIFK